MMPSLALPGSLDVAPGLCTSLLVVLIVWPKIKVRLRGPLLHSKPMAVKGTWQAPGSARATCAT
jgi:hypothetical protein